MVRSAIGGGEIMPIFFERLGAFLASLF